MLRRCANAECGREFETRNLRRVFCCERCRRTGQNASRRSARAEARQARERTRPMADPWAQLPADEWEAETVWANALLDAVPAGLAENPTRGGECFGAFFSCAEPPAAALFVDAASDADFSGAEPSASDVAVPDAAASAVSGAEGSRPDVRKRAAHHAAFLRAVPAPGDGQGAGSSSGAAPGTAAGPSAVGVPAPAAAKTSAAKASAGEAASGERTMLRRYGGAGRLHGAGRYSASGGFTEAGESAPCGRQARKAQLLPSA